MTAAGVLIGVGVMLGLSGVMLAVAALRGFALPGRPIRVHPWPRLRRSHAVVAAAGLLVFVLTGWPAAAAGAAGAVLIVPAILDTSATVQEIARLEGLAGWARRVADLLASGAAGSLEAAIRRSETTTPPSIGGAVATLVVRIGPQGLEPALRRFADDVNLPAGDLVVAALILRSRHGGRGLVAVLTGLADDLDEQVRTARDVEADRAKPRANVRMMVLFTLALVAGLVLFARQFLAPYATPLGQLALTGVVAVFAAALLWLRRLSRPVQGVRFLNSSRASS
jgi:tight adherence protein B